MDKPEPTQGAVPSGWINAIERGEADLAAGRTLPIDTVISELRTRLDRMKDRAAEKSSDAA